MVQFRAEAIHPFVSIEFSNSKNIFQIYSGMTMCNSSEWNARFFVISHENTHLHDYEELFRGLDVLIQLAYVLKNRIDFTTSRIVLSSTWWESVRSASISVFTLGRSFWKQRIWFSSKSSIFTPIFFLSMIFMATYWPVSRWVANFTFPNPGSWWN